MYIKRSEINQFHAVIEAAINKKVKKNERKRRRSVMDIGSELDADFRKIERSISEWVYG